MLRNCINIGRSWDLQDNDVTCAFLDVTNRIAIQTNIFAAVEGFAVRVRCVDPLRVFRDTSNASVQGPVISAVLDSGWPVAVVEILEKPTRLVLNETHAAPRAIRDDHTVAT